MRRIAGLEMKNAFAVVCFVGLCACVCACGSGGGDGGVARSSIRTAEALARSGSVTTRGRYYVGDHDDDDFKHSEPDVDDVQIRTWGARATRADFQEISTLVKRYYAAAGAADGTLACSLLASSLAESPSLGEASGGAYVAPPDAATLHGKPCAQVVGEVFGENHPELAVEIPTLQITAVRVAGAQGLALLGFKTTPERVIAVLREGGTWKIDGLLDGEMP